MDSEKITLISVACTKVPETIEAIRKCQKYFDFAESILITHENIKEKGIKVIKVEKLDYKGYNEFVAMELWRYINTSYCLLVQNDGYIINPEKWTDEFLNWDYIGSVWPIPPKEDKISYRTPSGRLVRVGNGGFSFRSKKLLEAPSKLGLEFTDMGSGFPHEDGFLCVHKRRELESYGIKFAPLSIAVRFSRELPIPEGEGIEPFGFHRYKP